VHEDREVAAWLQQELDESFMGLFDVFVSSERQAHAGEDWLRKIEDDLGRCTVLIALCSAFSVDRPWVNFELGAAWVLRKRIIPVFHGVLRPGKLRNPLSTLHAVAIGDPDDLETLYETLAVAFGFSRMPERDFAGLAAEVPTGPAEVRPSGEDDDANAIRERLRHALTVRQPWRTIGALATAAAVDEETVLRRCDEVRFGKSKSGSAIAGLKERVGD
jgi:hypothetical protein